MGWSCPLVLISSTSMLHVTLCNGQLATPLKLTSHSERACPHGAFSSKHRKKRLLAIGSTKKLLSTKSLAWNPFFPSQWDPIPCVLYVACSLQDCLTDKVLVKGVELQVYKRWPSLCFKM